MFINKAWQIYWDYFKMTFCPWPLCDLVHFFVSHSGSLWEELSEGEQTFRNVQQNIMQL